MPVPVGSNFNCANLKTSNHYFARHGRREQWWLRRRFPRRKQPMRASQSLSVSSCLFMRGFANAIMIALMSAMRSNRMNRQIIFGLCVASLMACSANPPPLDAASARTAVIRHIIVNDTYAKPMKLKTICAGFGKLGALYDPNRAVLNILREQKPGIRPASACALDEKSGLVKDLSTAQLAIIFYAETVVCTAIECKVTGGYLIGNLGAEGRTYIATPTGQGWKIRSDLTSPAWIS